MPELVRTSPQAISAVPTPPQDLEAERALLGAMMLGNESLARAIELIEPSVFYRNAHKKCFEAMIELFNRQEKCDAITIGEELRKRGDFEAVGGYEGVARLFDYATTGVNIDSWTRIVHEKFVLRELLTAAREIQEEAMAARDETAEILNRAEQRIFQITDARVRKSFVAVSDLLKSTFAHIETLAARQVRVTGVPSGFKDLDELTAGFQKGDLIVIAGRPSMGKTSLAINIAEHAAIAQKPRVPVAVFSLEMSVDQLVLRMLCSQGRVSLQKVRSGFLGKEDWPNLVTGAGLLQAAPIYVDDSGAPNILEIRAKCRRLAAEGKLGLVVVDYLQLIRGSGNPENRVQEVSQITRGLKALAKELSVPVIALSQLSRAVETRGSGGRPQLSDLRESGSIEQDADVVMFVYREEKYKPDDPTLRGQADILVAKQRNGPTGDIKLTFIHEYTRFEDSTLAPLMDVFTEDSNL